MLTSIAVTIENDEALGGVVINSETSLESISDMTNISILRRDNIKNEWNEIYNIELSTVDDLEFCIVDVMTRPNVVYAYSVDITNGNSIIESELFTGIKAEFDGMIIANENKSYLAGTEIKIEATRNTECEYVTTLQGRTPYRVSNANSNYVTGEAEGLFLKLTDDKKRFIPDTDMSYAREVIDFLSDGSGKILKTSMGDCWYVSIDTTITRQFDNRFSGYNIIQFSFTEIGDVPEFGMIMKVEQ